MKMKNHEWVDGKLLQTNKKYSHLKQKQKERLKSKPHSCRFKALLYEHGTHFAFPESMLKIMLPAGGSLLVGAAFRAGRKYPKECRETRRDIDRKLRAVLRRW